jgi:hypothetical protein
MNFGNNTPGPGILPFRPVMIRLVFLELYIEVIIHRVNKLAAFHTGFFRSLAWGKCSPWRIHVGTHNVWVQYPEACQYEEKKPSNTEGTHFSRSPSLRDRE